jgi:hypothetical protein
MIKHTDCLVDMDWFARTNNYTTISTYGKFGNNAQVDDLLLVKPKDLLSALQEVDFKATRKLAIRVPLEADNKTDIGFYTNLMRLAGDADVLVNINSDCFRSYSTRDNNGTSCKHMSHRLMMLNKGFFLFAKYNSIPENLRWMQNIGARYLSQ